MKSMSENKRLFIVLSVMAITVFVVVAMAAVMLYQTAAEKYESMLLKTSNEQRILLQQVEKHMYVDAESQREIDEASNAFIGLVKNMIVATMNEESITDIWMYVKEGGRKTTTLVVQSNDGRKHKPTVLQQGLIPPPEWSSEVPTSFQSVQWKTDNALFVRVAIELPNVRNSLPRQIVMVKRIELRRIRLPFINTFFIIFLAAQLFIWGGSSLISSQINPLIKYLDRQLLFNEAILNTATIPIITTDKNDKIMSVNRATTEVFERDADALKGLKVQSLFDLHPHERHYETRSIKEKGVGKLLSISQGVAQVGESQMHVYLAQDITLIKETEENLREATEHMALVVETVNDGVVTCSINGEITSVNPAAEVIFERPSGELLGRQLSNYIHPTPALNQRSQSVEASILKPDDSLIPVEVSYREYQRHDDTYFSCVVRDITERKAADERYMQAQNDLKAAVDNRTSEVKALVETAVVGVVSIDQRGRILSFNPAAETMFGYEAEEILYKNVSLLIPTIQAEEHDKYIQRYLKTKKARIIGRKNEVTALRKDGSQFDALLSVGHKELSNNNHLFVAHILDVTEAKRTEAELIEAKERAEEAARVKANFLANMSHEIRTPMNAIIGFSEVLALNRSLDTAAQQQVETIRTSGQSLLTILNDILDFSKFEAGKVPLESVCFNFGNMVRDCVEVMRMKANSKRLILTLAMKIPEPHRVLGDPNRIRQVLINLLGNAIKFTQHGSIDVTVELTEKDDSELVVHVEDTGIGMSKAQLDTVFESFSQADSSTTRRFGGTGLGTAISRQIVEAMGGHIWAESQKSVGSRFSFSLNLLPCDQEVNCLYDITNKYTNEAVSQRSLSILLAEDITENANLVELRLAHLGHRITWVKDGLEALKALDNGHFDLVLMDIMMPQLDGIEAAKRIRSSNKRYATIPIVALTASVLMEEQNRCLQAGMNAVEHKPINFPSLQRTMDRVVNGGRVIANKPAEEPQIPTAQTDMSYLSELIDVSMAIDMWGSPDKYVESLQYFSEYIDEAVEELSQSLESEHYDIAAQQIHAIKGTVGNLHIVDAFQLSQRLETLIDKQELVACSQTLSSMKDVFNKLHELLAKGNKANNEPNKQMVVDTAILLALLHDLLDSIQLCNPDQSLPIVQSLANLLPYSDVSELESSLENFDFEHTKELVYSIAQRYQLKLEKE